MQRPVLDNYYGYNEYLLVDKTLKKIVRVYDSYKQT